MSIENSAIEWCGLKILTFTSLYPNAIEPHLGVFVENRLRHLLRSGAISGRVVAPVPWFPFSAQYFGRYAKLSRVPSREERFGVEVWHPRYPVIPKVGMNLAPLLLYGFARAAIARLIDAGYEFDLLDAHYFYPDGVAAVMLGRHFGKPVTITARGTDINVIPRYLLPRRQIIWAAKQAAAVISVSQALKEKLVQLGIERERVSVLRNGVDLEIFQPVDNDAFKSRHGLQSPLLLSVGNLVAGKGHNLVVRALRHLPDASLAIAGSGPEEASLNRLIGRLGLQRRVRLLGDIPHECMPEAYSAADILVLASSREGWANVLLESMACGTPVIASNVGGAPEAVLCPEAGLLLPERTPDMIAEAATLLLATPPSRSATRRYAERFSWQETTEGQLRLFRGILRQGLAG